MNTFVGKKICKSTCEESTKFYVNVSEIVACVMNNLVGKKDLKKHKVFNVRISEIVACVINNRASIRGHVLPLVFTTLRRIRLLLSHLLPDIPSHLLLHLPSILISPLALWSLIFSS